MKSYEILHLNNVDQIEGLNVPQILGCDDELMIVEMTFVSAPYLLDFGKAYFSQPDFPLHVTEEVRRQCEEDFGIYLPIIDAALYELQLMGIWYVDANLRNINCDGLAPPPDS